ncbi:protein CANDIDATE G-PROTEIN COUPLED RECEPTOR 7 [Fagus crenata]
METFNIFPLNHYPILQVSYALLIISTIPFALSEIKNSHIIDDSRDMIYFHKFGFSQHGQASISIKDVSWKSKDHKAQFNASSMGFVLLNYSSFDSFLKETIYIKDFCILSSHYVKVLFTFEKLTTNSSTYNVSTAIDGPSRNSLIFGNCQREFEVSMDVHTEMYNVRHGEKDFLPVELTELPMIFSSYLAAIEKIHIIMGALLLFKTLNMLCAFEDKIYVRKTGAPPLGWDVAYYVFGLFQGIILFTVIVLIGTGWSFLKPYLQEREKKVLMVVIPLQILENIAYVIQEQTVPKTIAWFQWHNTLLVIDIMCCGAVFFPIYWSITGLKEASKTDGKAARTLEKLTLFKKVYIVIVVYMYFTRVGVLEIGGLVNYRYWWVLNALDEGARFAFYVFLFYNFKPIERNPYLVIDEEEENDARNLLETDRFGDTFGL